MATIAKKYTSQIDKIKKKVQSAHDYFEENYKRFHEFMKFTFSTSLSQQDVQLLNSLKKPIIEFNILEAYISRLAGEFSKMDPGFKITASEVNEHVDPALLRFLEGHFRALSSKANKDNTKNGIFLDQLGGGFSVVEVYTDYPNERSFNQNIYIKKASDPTMCGFDPLAKEVHKGDGAYAFKLTPHLEDELTERFGSDAIKGMGFTRNYAGFSWSYKNNREKIGLVCEFYSKEYKEEKILQLSNQRVVTQREYDQLLENWEQAEIIAQPPVPIGKSRKAHVSTIVKYTVVENKILDVEKTSYRYLPLVFFDGNSVHVRDTEVGGAHQMTRPLVYNAKDAQRLKNFAGQTLANELENMIQHKWIAPVEGIPEDYKDAYEDPQQATVVMYKAYRDDVPEQPLPAPREVARVPTPPEVTNTFMGSDSLVQSILGSYDAALGINKNELSGKAIMQGAMQSNATSMPFINGFINGWTRVSEICLDLIPKHWVTPRSIPIVLPNGKKDYMIINDQQQEGSISMNFEPHSLEVEVEAGPNFAVQKQIALETLVQLMNASETFNMFINQEGLGILLDNLEIRGIDAIKDKAEEFMQKQKEQQQQAQEMQANQPPPEMIEAQLEEKKLEQKRETDEAKILAGLKSDQLKNAVDTANVAVKNKAADQEFIVEMAKLNGVDDDRMIQQEKVDAENARTAVTLAIDLEKHTSEQEKSLEDVIRGS